MKKRPAKGFQDLIVWKKYINFKLILAKDLCYGVTLLLRSQLEEVCKLLEVYYAYILDSGS
jgi:hypothetical protein